jgi:hypothetical protein
MLVFTYACTSPDHQTPPKINGATYTMQFNLTASGTPLTMGQTVTNSGNTKYYLDVLRFSAGFPRLVKTDGNEVPLANVMIVKFDNGIPDNAVCGHSFSFPVPAGDYKAIRFGVGMPSKIKDTVSHYHFVVLDPLNANYGMLWEMTKNTFRNIAIAMYADTTKAQNAPPKRFLSFHILEDDTTLNLYRDLEFPASFSIGDGGAHTSVFNLDANQVFFNAANLIDLRKAGSTDMVRGDKTGINLGIQITNNFAKAIANQ